MICCLRGGLGLEEAGTLGLSDDPSPFCRFPRLSFNRVNTKGRTENIGAAETEFAIVRSVLLDLTF